MDNYGQAYTNKVLILKQAMIDKKQISFNYKEETSKRFVNPHCQYINKRDVAMLDAYQEHGETSSNNLQFKMFNIGNMHKIKIEDKTFEVNKDFKVQSDRYKNFVCKIGV